MDRLATRWTAAALAASALTVLVATTLLAAQTAAETKLIAGDGAAGDRLGRVAASLTSTGKTAVFGAYLKDDAGESSGAAYVYHDDGTGWVEQAKLTASDAAPRDLFGQAVSISGDTVDVGSFMDDDAGSHSGSVYVYERSGGTWPETAKLRAADGAEGDQLGIALAISGNGIVAGAWAHDDGAVDAGAAYVFRSDGTRWTQEAELNAGDGAAGDKFGRAVSVDGDVVVVGSVFADAGATDAGAAYVFRWNGTSWTQEAKLVAPDAGAGDWLGFSVGVSGDTAVVGAYRNGGGANKDKGAAYVFRFDGTRWDQEARLTASDSQANDRFGWSVAISGETIVVGTPLGDAGDEDTGSVYVFHRTGTVWTEDLKLHASDSEQGDAFGASVSVVQDTVFVGAPGEDDSGSSAGAVYVYEMIYAEAAVGATVTSQPDLESVASALQEIVDSDPAAPLVAKVEDAIAKVEAASNELAKTPPDAQAAAGNIEGAVGDLAAAVREGLDPSQGMQLMDQLAGSAGHVGSEAVGRAITSGGNPGHINKAQRRLAHGDALRAAGEFKDAVGRYSDAVREADRASR